jgi:polysaccharide export outer membrane protein
MRAPAFFTFMGLLALSRLQAQVTAPETAPNPATEAMADAPDAPAAKPAADDDRAPTLAPMDPDYLLQPDDVIEVVVFREPDLNTNAIVRKDGRFEMKLLGSVQVGGLTADQATEAIRAALAKDYLVSPRVSLSIVSYAKRKINVLGEVRAPGLYNYPEHGTLMLSDAIALAGGFLPTSDAARVAVRRSTNGHVQVETVDASAGGEGSQGDGYEVKPDDAITIPLLPKRHFTVLGQINRPGDYDVTDDRPVYLTDAIALAGGFTRLANPAKVLLKRSDHGRESVMEINAKAMEKSPATERLLIQDEDTITVPESLF